MHRYCVVVGLLALLSAQLDFSPVRWLLLMLGSLMLQLLGHQVFEVWFGLLCVCALLWIWIDLGNEMHYFWVGLHS